MTTPEDAIADAQDDAAFADACCSKTIGEIQLTPVTVENSMLADVAAVCLADQAVLSCQWRPAGEFEALERHVVVNDVIVPVVEQEGEFVADLSSTPPSFRERYAGAVADLVQISDAALLPTTREVFNEQMRHFRELSSPEQVSLLRGDFPKDSAFYEGWARAHQDIVDDLNEVAANAVHV